MTEMMAESKETTVVKDFRDRLRRAYETWCKDTIASARARGEKWPRRTGFHDLPSEIQDYEALEAWTGLASRVRYRHGSRGIRPKDYIAKMDHAQTLLERTFGMRPSIDLLRELDDYGLVVRFHGGRWVYPNPAHYSYDELYAAGLLKTQPRNATAKTAEMAPAHRERLIARCREVGYVPKASAAKQLDSWRPYWAAITACGGAEGIHRIAFETGLPVYGLPELEKLENARK